MVATYVPGPHGPMVVARASAGTPPAWTATDNPAGQGTGTNSVTFTNANIGTASAGRIVVAIFTSGTTVANAMTIGGISATKAVEESTILSGLQIWYANVPTGTTATIVVSSSGSMNLETIQVGMLTGVTAVPTATQTAAGGATDPATITITVPATGIAIVGLMANDDLTATGSWSNATLDFKTGNSSAATLTMAHTTTTGSVTPTYTGLGGGNAHMVVAAWGP